MTDHLTENARLRAALEQIVALNIAASLPWTHEQAADNYWRMIDAMKGVARAALATPAPDAPDLTDPTVIHANMLRGTIAKPTVAQIIHLYGSAVFLELLYKRGLCKPTVAPAHDAVQEAARVPEIAALIEAAKSLVCHDGWGTVNYTDNGMWFDAETLRAALRAIAGDRT